MSREIILRTRHRNTTAPCIIDDELFVHIAQYHWYEPTGCKYAKATIDGHQITMSHLVWQLKGKVIPQGHNIDHRDGDTMNNQFSNLRLVTIREHSSRQWFFDPYMRK